MKEMIEALTDAANMLERLYPGYIDGSGPYNEGIVERDKLIARIRALSVPAAAVVGEPVAWTTQAQIDKFTSNPGCNAIMWGEPLPHHPDIPLYTAPSAPEGMREALEKIAAMRWHEDADLDDICTIADRALGGAHE